MNGNRNSRVADGARGFTLIELLTALLILSMLALMSYRGLGAVLDAREHVRQETEKWRKVAAFMARFERDLQLAAPRPVRGVSGAEPAWRGRAGASLEPGVEFSRFAGSDGMDAARRLGYRLNEREEIELWLWPGLDVASGAVPARYPVLGDVMKFELRYLNADVAWVNTWPDSADLDSVPRGVQLRIVLDSGEEIVRFFSLQS